jgi:hypothetical protein
MESSADFNYTLGSLCTGSSGYLGQLRCDITGMPFKEATSLLGQYFEENITTLVHLESNVSSVWYGV